ncbi:hypothetical protein MJO28_005615 [Puccinia striiformis f. sp. tritici]|uniref:Uncharacterized protein n=1 Tax=Puccinia striiformis f. sp. tritici TaxID=168172 RepID=A0ACC0ELN8_9BASI|nr:hypothetical protein MJO28_005615 [Puccinia striiformis f. sp. tritici]KAI9620629.1 hypothetical protein KEM48_007978 [Puccinia striiformis f. sp. tritici PST-130]
MRLPRQESFLLFPLLLIRLSSALPLLSGASGGTHIGKTAFELPNSPVASTQASKHGEDLGTIIHQTANTVLDELISNARSDREDYKTPFYLGQIREVYPLRHSEACTQMENHPAYDMIAKAFGVRALYLKGADKFEQADMDSISREQPPEIHATIAKIDEYCSWVFPPEDERPVTGLRILEVTMMFRNEFHHLFNGRYSKQIEEKMSISKDPEFMVPKFPIQDFHSKLIAIEEWNSRHLLHNLHDKLDKALGRTGTGRLTNHLEPIGGVNPNDFLMVLAMSLHPKFDELIRELIDTGRYGPRRYYRSPGELKDEKALVLHLHSKLDPLIKKINLKWFPIMQDLMHLNRDIRFFILELDQKLDLVLAALSNERKITSRIAIMFEKVISASYDNVSRFISAFDRPELFDGSSLSSTLPAMLFQHKLNRMSASPVVDSTKPRIKV